MRPRDSATSTTSTSRVNQAFQSPFVIMEDYAPNKDQPSPHDSPNRKAPIKSALPLKTKPISIFSFPIKAQKPENKSYHLVEQVKKKKGTDANYFFKHNSLNSPMSVLEATACHFYQFVILDLAPTAHAHIDDSKANMPYVAVSSKGIPNFKSTMQDPLTQEDLNDPNIVKGLAYCLTASYIFGEDDLHRGNMSKYGQRIDFDMSFWKIFCHYKDAGIIDWTFRFPTESSTQITENDILHFPNLKDASPFYWPTTPQRIIPESIYKTLSIMLELSQNSFRNRDNEVYRLLETNPIFIYNKYKLLLKFILVDYQLYGHIAKLHIPEEMSHIITALKNHQRDRIQKFTHILLAMPDFKDYILYRGKEMKSEILDELKTWNESVIKKIDKHPEYKNILINLDNIQEKFNKIVEITQRPAYRHDM